MKVTMEWFKKWAGVLEKKVSSSKGQAYFVRAVPAPIFADRYDNE